MQSDPYYVNHQTKIQGNCANFKFITTIVRQNELPKMSLCYHPVTTTITIEQHHSSRRMGQIPDDHTVWNPGISKHPGILLRAGCSIPCATPETQGVSVKTQKSGSFQEFPAAAGTGKGNARPKSSSGKSSMD